MGTHLHASTGYHLSHAQGIASYFFAYDSRALDVLDRVVEAGIQFV